MSPGQIGAVAGTALSLVLLAAGIVYTVRKDNRAGTAASVASDAVPASQPRPYLTPEDEAAIRALAGRNFTHEDSLLLPSGQILPAAEAQVFAAYFAPSADRRRS